MTRAHWSAAILAAGTLLLGACACSDCCEDEVEYIDEDGTIHRLDHDSGPDMSNPHHDDLDDDDDQPTTLDRAQRTIRVGGATIRAEAYVWRNAMPVVGRGGPSLYAAVRLATDDGEIPAGVLPVRVHVYQGALVWDTAFGDDEPRLDPGSVERTARGGPDLKPDSFVDLAVEVHAPDGSGGTRTHWLRVTRQRVNNVQ